MKRIKFDTQADEMPRPGEVLGEMATSPVPECERVEFISSGSLMLNLAASCRGIDGGWARGRIHNIVGDGSSGKTLTELELMAYAYHKLVSTKTELFPKPKKLRLVYYNAENVMDFPVEAMYGKDFYNSVEWLHKPFVEDLGEHFFNEVVGKHKEGEVVLAAIDSWDSLRSKTDAASYEKNLKKAAKAAAKAAEEGSDGDAKAKGSYNLGKQKYGSQYFFPNCCAEMQGRDITLGIISQVRSKIGITFGEKQYRAGGDSLNFYTHQVCWLAEVEKLAHTVKGHKRPYGIKVRARFKRNKCAVPFRNAEFNVVFNYGIADVESMLEWRYGQKFTSIRWKGKDWTRSAIIKLLEENNEMYKVMAQEITAEWQDIEANINPKQGKRKYGP
jgi:RecA/RadA recombinase